MKKFKFELEDVLKLRKFEQEQAQIELGKAVAVETEIQNKLDEIAKQQLLVKQSISGSKDFSVIAQSNKFFNMLKLQTESLLEDMAKAKLVTEEKRALFMEALQKTESLTKLKEKQLELYHKAEDLEEEDVTDDIVTSRYGLGQ